MGQLSLLVVVAITTIAAVFSIDIETNYVKVSFNYDTNSIDQIYADFLGGKNFSYNLLAKPLQVEVALPIELSTSHYIKSTNFDKKFSATNPYQLMFESVITLDGVDFILHKWNIQLSPKTRKIGIETEGAVLQNARVSSISYGIYLPNPSLFGLFDSGITQMMGKAHSCLGSNDTLERAYFMGGNSAMDITTFSTNYIDSSKQNSEVVLISSTENAYKSGIQHVVFGNYPHKTKKLNAAWSNLCWSNVEPVALVSGEKWNTKIEIIPNNYNFPAFLVADVEASTNNMDFKYLQPYLTGIYGSPVGCLQSYYENQKGIIAPTISHPDVGYDPDTNFFDPDNFISLSAMMYSGDGYLMQQVKNVLERTGQTMCGIGNDQDHKYCGMDRQLLKHKPLSAKRFLQFSSMKGDARFNATSRSGQLMHHFISLSPTYESIATSEQLGCNIFWTWSVLRYISISQDYDWAKSMLPFIELSTKFLLSFVDPDKEYMVNAPGPLWIDVLVRENYTSDSNAIMVPILKEIAQYYTYLGVDYEFAMELENVAAKIQTAVNKYLWAPSHDHLITQLNPDGTSRDFVDYDSNLIAVAFGVVPDDKVDTVLQRVDNGSFTHVRATWASEIPYSGDRCDCYIVGGTTCGDSVVTLARIGWVDSLARYKVRDAKMVRDVLLQPIIDDLVKNTWLYERYDSNGNQIRTSFYFEYPSLVAMMLREVVYGIDISLNHVKIDPIEYLSYKYHLGTTKVYYDKTEVLLQLPSANTNPKAKKCTIHHMDSDSKYQLVSSCNAADNDTIMADVHGVLTFQAVFGRDCEVRISKVSI